MVTMPSREMGSQIIACTVKMRKCWKTKAYEMIEFDKASDLGANKNASDHNSAQIPNHYSKGN